MNYKNKIHKDRLPHHVAIIMDGNGRWAARKGEARTFGHQHGVKAVRAVVEACAELGIKYLTLYAFSTENWNRPQHEVDLLMELLVTTISKETKTLNENNIRLQAIGNLQSLPVKCRKEMEAAIRNTSKNKRTTLVLALSYSAKWEIVEAVKAIVRDVKNKQIKPEAVNEKVFSSYLCTAGIPDPELLIRTSGESRISNFLLWQLAYTELYFTKKLWPDFRKQDLYKALVNYQGRERRFGLTSEQVK